MLFLAPSISYSQTDLETRLFGFINSDRAREHLAPLKWNDTLYAVALEHSRDMAHQGRVSHTGSDGSQPHERIHASSAFATRTAENVARDLNIVSAHTTLMESVYHRENILDPEMTDAAAGVVLSGGDLYITEVFIKSLEDVPLSDARAMLLGEMNSYRQSKNLPLLQLSSSLSGIAQSHTEVQESLNALSPPLLLHLVTQKVKGAVHVHVYTGTDLALPDELHANLDRDADRVGIGFKRVKGPLCEGGCYLVSLIFASQAPKEPQE